MRRLPVIAFLTLVAATVAAFFITQHLKVSTPLIAGSPQPVPAAINPVNGGTCYDAVLRERIDSRMMHVSFYLLHQSDLVDVHIVNEHGTTVATLARHLYMQGGDHPLPMQFTWDGRTAAGTVAPDGVYYVEVHLIHQGRIVTISNSSGPLPVRVDTVARCP